MTLLKKMRQMGNYMRIGLAALALAGRAYANNFNNAVVPPTRQQLEERLVWTGNKTSSSFSLISSPKYFGKTIGAIVNIPYVWNSNGTRGMGDANIMLCVVAKQGTSNYIPFIGLKIPSGELSSKTYDLNFGTLVTYWINNKKAEVNFTLKYTMTGSTPQGINPPNQLFLAAFAGGQVAKNLRIAAGTNLTANSNGDYQVGARAGTKFIIGDYDWIIEVFANYVVAQQNMPGKYSFEVSFRFNPKKG